MAITGGAALIGAVAAGSGYVAVSTVVIAGLAMSAVGMVTGNKLLSKLGGGLSIGAGIGGLAGGLMGAGAGAAGGAASDVASTASATAGTAADATTTAIAAPSIADAAGAGSQAAGDLAEGTLGTAATTGSGAPVAFGGVAAPEGAAVDSTLAAAANPTAGNSINANLAADTSPAASTAAPAQASNTIASNIAAPSPSADAMGLNGQTGSGAPMGFSNPGGVDAGTFNGTGQGLTTGSSFMGDLAKNVSGWWGGLDSKEKLVVGQVGAGLVQGIGSGALNMMSESQKQKLLQQQQQFRINNMSGAGAIPTVSIQPTGAMPYSAPTATTTPVYAGAGLINGAKTNG